MVPLHQGMVPLPLGMVPLLQGMVPLLILEGTDFQGLHQGLVTAQTLMEMGGIFLLTIDHNQVMEQGEDHQTTGLIHQTTGLNHQTTGLSQDPPTEDMVMTDPKERILKIDMATTMLKVCHGHRCHHVRLPEVGVRQGTENV